MSRRPGHEAGARRREATLRRLGLAPSLAEVLRTALDDAVGHAEASRAARLDPASPDGAAVVVALDAGCGRHSPLAPYRGRIGRFVGVDVHPPVEGALPYLDQFVAADLCASPDAFPPATFDVVLCSFAVEHFRDPAAAFANLARWLRPGGTLVLTTVNRRHPFVAAYLALPEGLRRRVQPVVKETAGDAHPLVGACNEPAALRHALAASGFEVVRVEAVGHLARAWGRRLPTFVLGVTGDLLARATPSRRSTLVVQARIPEAAG